MRKMAAIEVDKDQDPREALLKYAKVGRRFSLFYCVGCGSAVSVSFVVGERERAP